MNDQRLKEIRSRCEKISSEEWEPLLYIEDNSPKGSSVFARGPSHKIDKFRNASRAILKAEKDAEFVSRAREDIRYLLSKIEQLTDQNIRYENALRSIIESGVVDCLECQSHERDALEALRKKP